jgi:septum site-determining protein MinC
MKGTRKGLAIALEEGEWQDLLRELDTRLDQASTFFRGSQVNLTTGKRDINQAELQQFMDVLTKHEIQLASLRTASEISAQAAQALGVRLALPEVSGDQTEIRGPIEELSEGLLVRRTLRSGQSLQHLGHVVVIGDVNPGAEIIAGGDVVVWGRVRGMIHAGALGDNRAIVCALELRPTQLRIGSHIATSPPETGTPSSKTGRDSGSPSRLSAEGKRDVQPEVAFVQDELIVAEPWSGR